MSSSTPTAKSVPASHHYPYERAQLKRIVVQRGLCGLANDTKWDELLSAMQSRIHLQKPRVDFIPGTCLPMPSLDKDPETWTPRFRFKCIDGPASAWDGEWFYHLPFPLISVEWFDLWHLQPIGAYQRPRVEQVIDHSPWIEALLQQIGFDYKKGTKLIRIFGYSPRRLDFFDRESVA